MPPAVIVDPFSTWMVEVVFKTAVPTANPAAWGFVVDMPLFLMVATSSLMTLSTVLPKVTEPADWMVAVPVMSIVAEASVSKYPTAPPNEPPPLKLSVVKTLFQTAFPEALASAVLLMDTSVELMMLPLRMMLEDGFQY